MPDLGQQIYDALRAAIFAGELPPGSPLSRRKVAERFGVSPLPVAAALQRLEAEGFVESRPRAGTRVRIPSSSEILGNYVLREALETQAARLFAGNATKLQRQRLLRLAVRLDAGYEQLEQATEASREEHGRLEKEHLEFHFEIANATGCKELVDAIERTRVLLFNWLISRIGEYSALPRDWHQRLAEALVSGDPLRADAAMREHVRFRRDANVDRFAEIEAGVAGPIERGPQKASSKV
jgi:DNA-binding GntR family transcriptional regulator